MSEAMTENLTPVTVDVTQHGKGIPPPTLKPEYAKPAPVPYTGPYWYRIEDYTESYTVDADREVYATRVRVRLLRYEVAKETPKGVRLNGPGAYNRLVLHASTRKFALPNLNAARGSFLARKRKQVAIFDKKIQNAWLAIGMSLELIEGDAQE